MTDALSRAAAGVALALIVLWPLASAAAPRCAGDCDDNGAVGVDELMRGVEIALDRSTVDQCRAFDIDGDGEVVIYEVLSGVERSLQGCPAYPRDDQLRLNRIQVLGTHNSYHIQADPFVFQAIANVSEALAETLQYTHPPLPDQFNS